MDFVNVIVTRFLSGGFFMWFILAVGVFSLFLLIDRGIVLFLVAKKAPTSFRTQLRTFLKSGDLDGALEFAKSCNNKLLTPIIEEACKLRASGAGDDELQSRMDERLTEAIHRIDKRTSFLAVVGNVATLIGLLGTISGMITSFASVTGASAAERAAKLSIGISEAMNCTAFGLLVAIPALLAYAFYQNRTDKTVSWLTDTVAKVYNDLVYTYEPKTRSSNV